MRYIDGILAPLTIKSGVYVTRGMAYFTVGNFVAVVRSGHNPDLILLAEALG